MTKKDYELIARSFNRARLDQLEFMADIEQDDEALEQEKAIKLTREYLAIDLAHQFSQDNPRFDRKRFLTACGIED